jgi:hypothetical protein
MSYKKIWPFKASAQPYQALKNEPEERLESIYLKMKASFDESFYRIIQSQRTSTIQYYKSNDWNCLNTLVIDTLLASGHGKIEKEVFDYCFRASKARLFRLVLIQDFDSGIITHEAYELIKDNVGSELHRIVAQKEVSAMAYLQNNNWQALKDIITSSAHARGLVLSDTYASYCLVHSQEMLIRFLEARL